MTTHYSSPPKRPAPVPVLDTNAALQQDAFRTSSPPRTPQNWRPGGVRPQTGSRVSTRTGKRETFLDDVTPVDGSRGSDSGDEKDPHDLTFPSKHVTRVSVVDNMLMALDQFSNSTTGAVASRDPPNAGLRYNSIIGRRRGNTFSSDVSSDNESRDENIHPQSYHRSKRSNSNSNPNFPRGLQPVPSLYEEEEPHTRHRVFDSQRAFGPADQRCAFPTQNGRKSGKGSGSSSIDLGQALSGSRLGSAGNRRSQSFDYGSDRRGVPIFEKDVAVNRANNARTEMEAAPRPIVHADPRRGHSPIRHNASAPLSPTHDPGSAARRNSAKSSKSQYARKGKDGNTGVVNGKSRDELRDLHDNVENLPPMPTYFPPLPQSPSFGSRKPSQISLPDVAPHSKERPGFFRRVFGSKNASATSIAQVTESDNRILRDAITTPPIEEPFHAHNSLTKQHRQTPKDLNTTNASVPKEQQTITKKSSAFFRRRKKSVCEQMPPPVPLSLQLAKIEAAESSPVSSLRQVMDPYLAGPPLPSPTSRSQKDSPQGFHTAHTSFSQRNDASLNQDEKTQDASTQLEQTSANVSIPGAKDRPKLRVPRQDHQDSTFLADSSGTEEPSTSSKRSTPRALPDGPSRTSPAISSQVHGSEGLLPVRFPFNSTSNSRATTPSSGSRTPHSPSSPTLPNFPVASKTTRPSALTIQREAPKSSRRGNSSKDHAARAVDHSPPPSGSDLSVYKSAPSTPISPYNMDGDGADDQSPSINISASREATPVQSKSEDDPEQALKIFENRDENLEPGEVSAWLGDAGNARERVRTAYMSLFNWTKVDILSALRGLCARIALKGETQQVDRMLEAFSKRWCECNYKHGFKSSGKF